MGATLTHRARRNGALLVIDRHTATRPYAGAHFATFPPDLIEPCILAGSPVGGIVLDPFMGSGTTAVVATKHDRFAIGCELNPDYIELIRERMGGAIVVE